MIVKVSSVLYQSQMNIELYSCIAQKVTSTSICCYTNTSSIILAHISMDTSAVSIQISRIDSIPTQDLESIIIIRFDLIRSLRFRYLFLKKAFFSSCYLNYRTMVMQHIDTIIIDIQLQINVILIVVKNNPPSMLIQLLSQTCTGVDDRGRRGISAAVDI